MKQHTPLLAALAGAVVGSAVVLKSLRRRRAIDLRDRVALVTGGSRGLGLLIARELGRLGARVVIAAREEGELSRAREDLESRGVTVATIVADIASSADATRAVDEAAEKYGRLDLLVNNAGVITVSPFEHLTRDDFQTSMDVHFWGPLHALQAALPHLRRSGGGRIVNISSIGGKVGVPHLAAYCSSKFALTGLSQSLRAELAQENILVTTVCPGLMRTGSVFNAWFKGQHRQEFTWFAVAGSLPLMSIDAGRAARQIVDAARHGDAEAVISWPAKVAVAATAVVPNAAAAATGFANRLLPAPAEANGEQTFSGWQSSSRWAPSTFTRLSEQAAARNNELPERSASTAKPTR